jgi:predicted MPP superfamily phosphohydrolase
MGRLERLLLSRPAFNIAVAEAGKLFLSALVWPRFVAPYRWRLTRYPMPLAHLDPVFAGYKILHLTDLHVGKTRLDYLVRVVTACLREKPDLVVITGDLIDYQPGALPLLKDLLRELTETPDRAPDGVLAIFGNHDYHEYSWRHVGPRSARRSIHRRLVEVVEGAGVDLLCNARRRITRGTPGGGEAGFTVVGMDEMWTGLADAATAFRGLTADEPIVVLQHNPDGVEGLRAYPWQYMLCGHSHGGQATLPLVGPLYVPMEHRQYLRGFFHFPPQAGAAGGGRTMFVSTGLGHSTPIRLFCPPEATLFTLAGGPAAP